MALIACAECGKEVSDQSPACPGCGCPLGRSPVGVRTVEATGKQWKALSCVALLVVAVAVVSVVADLSFELGGSGIVLGIVLFVAGLVTSVVARAGQWWYHG